MAEESIPLSAASVEPAANLMARRYRGIAVAPSCIFGVFVLALVSYHVRHGFPHGVGTALITLVVTCGAPASLALWFLVKARRVAQIGSLARTTPSLSWHLAGRLVAAGDGAGSPRSDLGFEITAKVRAMLVALPRATAISRTEA